jgi:hypothetical protein
MIKCEVCGQIAEYNVTGSKSKKANHYCKDHMINKITETEDKYSVNRESHVEQAATYYASGGYKEASYE